MDFQQYGQENPHLEIAIEVNINDIYTGEVYTYSVGPFGWEGYISRVIMDDLKVPSQYYCYQVGNNIDGRTSFGVMYIHSTLNNHHQPQR